MPTETFYFLLCVLMDERTFERFHVYDKAPEKKLVMKIREGIVFMVIQHSQNTNIHSVCDVYRNNYVVFLL